MLQQDASDFPFGKKTRIRRGLEDGIARFLIITQNARSVDHGESSGFSKLADFEDRLRFPH